MNDINSLFGIGIENPYGKYFEGQSYLNPMVQDDISINNVTFEPGCINHWHQHLAESGGGQILLVTDGEGWYQEWGKPARKLKPGDVVIIPANTKHWHGASKDHSLAHVSIETPGVNTSTEWLEPVSEDEYLNL